MTDKLHSTVLPQIADGTPYTAVDVFGPYPRIHQQTR
jgi:hypothetical protein